MLQVILSLLQCATSMRNGNATRMGRLCRLCIVTMLQSMLIIALVQWQQYLASSPQPRSRASLPRTNTTAAELFYLRHMHSCAAATTGSKGGGANQTFSLELSGADVIGRMLHSICLPCYVRACRAVDWLLQSTGSALRCLAIVATPLELAACFHLANTCMQRLDLLTRYDAANDVWMKEIATTTLALLSLVLAVTDWHVPRWLPRHQLLCQIVSAAVMHTLRMDDRCTIMAFLVPTFGKRPQTESGAARKRTATMGPSTEQTQDTPTDTITTTQNTQDGPPVQGSISADESDDATQHIAAEAEAMTSMQAIAT